MNRTHVIFDGLQDPGLAGDLSARWHRAGLANALDPAGQCAWLMPASTEPASTEADSPDADSPDADSQSMAARSSDGLTEDQLLEAKAIARAFGLELRDRTGNQLDADADPDAIHDYLTKDYKRATAQALMFGLPALLLHYVGPKLASGGGADAGSMFLPWLIEMMLVGWMLWAAGWPIFWQGALSIIHLRASADTLTTLLVLVAFVPSAAAVVALPVMPDPWFGVPAEGGGPWFYIAAWAIVLAVIQRWLAHRASAKLRGRGHLMIYRYHRVIGCWMILCALIWLGTGIQTGWVTAGVWALALALLFPPMASIAAINPLTPGKSTLLPVFAFGGFLLLGGGAAESFGLDIDPVRIEIVACFGLMMTALFELGWRRAIDAGPGPDGGQAAD